MGSKCVAYRKLKWRNENWIGRDIWGDRNFDWAYCEAEGRSGGLISIWNSNVFSKSCSWHTKGLLVVKGIWLEDSSDLLLLNVYAPCNSTEKAQLWDIIISVTEQYEDYRICVAGDFNSIREESERIGRGEEVDRRDIRSFDSFICASGLLDLPLKGRKFTWFKPDGTCKSKLDRIMVKLQQKPDSWYWTDAYDGKFTTKTAYDLISGDLTQPVVDEREEAFELLWQSQAIRRHQAMAWKVLKLRMPTKDELQKRKIIADLQDTKCPLCEVEDETVVEYCYGSTFRTKPHLLQHAALFSSKKFEKYAIAIWVAVVDIIWRTRNLKVFEGTNKTVWKVVGEIKARTWTWLKVKSCTVFNVMYSDWFINPRMAIGMIEKVIG
ncbi:hypothetical protein ACS0TY_027301 [Phlomoides rotata]